MKLNVDVVLTDLDGNPLTTKEQASDSETNEIKIVDKPILLKDVIVNALVTMTKKDETLTGAEKFTLYTIAQTVHKGGEVDLNAKEIDKIQERVGTLYTPVIVGSVYDRLNALKG